MAIPAGPFVADKSLWQPMRTLTTGGGYLSALNNRVFFRRCLVGNNYNQVVTIINSGLVDDDITAVSSPVNFSVTHAGLPITVAAGSSVTITVSYAAIGPSPSKVSEEIDLTVANGRDIKLLAGASVVGGAPAEVHLPGGTAQQTLSAANTNYILDADMNVTGVAFYVTADNITLDTNGRTITYGDSSEHKSAVVCAADYRVNDSIEPGSGKGGGSSFGLVVEGGGTFTQRAGSGSKGHCFINWDHTGNNFHEIGNVTMLPVGDSSNGIQISHAGGLWVHDVTATSTSPTNVSRHTFWGYIFRIVEDYQDFARFTDNTISGGNQGGIVALVAHVQCAGNTITHQSIYVNGFGITTNEFSDVWRNDIPISYAVGAPAAGRGYSVGAHSRCWNNWAESTCSLTSEEFYAFQAEFEAADTTTGIRCYSNVLVGTSNGTGSGGATVKCTNVLEVSDALIHNNFIGAYRAAGSSTSARCVDSIIGYNDWFDSGTPDLIDNDYDVEENLFMSFWDGTRQLLIKGGTVNLGPNPAPAGIGNYDLSLAYLWVGNSHPAGFRVEDNLIIDVNYPASMIGTAVTRNVGSAPNCYVSIGVGYSYTLTCLDGASPVVGAAVTIVDGGARTNFSGVTDANGQIVANLAQTLTEGQPDAYSTQFDTTVQSVTIDTSGTYPTLNYDISVNATIVEDRQLGTGNSFTFIDQVDVPLSTLIESNEIAVSNDSAVTIVGGGGQFSINGGAWDYGPGAAVSGDVIKVRLLSSGSYSTGSATTLNLGADNDTFNITTIAAPANIPPVASFTYVATDLSVAFTDTSTDADGTIASWLWDFGDTNTSPLQNPTNPYATAGTYAVMLTVTDNDGGVDMTSQMITVNDPSMVMRTPPRIFDALGGSEPTAIMTQDELAKLDYTMDWAAWLPGLDTIVASTWSVTPGALLILSGDAFDDTAASVWITGGQNNQVYEISNKIVDSAGREAVRTFKVLVQDVWGAPVP